MLLRTSTGKVILLAVILIITIQNFKPKMNEEYYTNENYPIYATVWIKQHLDLNNIKLFNEYNYGSYLVYQGIPVMIDSRADLYSPEFNSKNDIFMDVQNVATGADNYETVFKNYGITHIITFSDSGLSGKLKRNKNYKKVYPDAFEQQQDSKFVIYERLSSADDNDESDEDQID